MIIRFKNFSHFLYIFFAFLSLNIFFFSTDKVEAKSFDVNNIEISKPFEINFDKNKVIDDGFIKAFSRLISTITVSSDQKIIKGIKLAEIKGMVESFSVKEENEERFRVVATDGHRLSRLSTELPSNAKNLGGVIIPRKTVIELRKKLRKDILLVVDDAYAEYMKNNDYKSGLDLFKKKENVFILRTFSKIYGLSSLRIGWGYGSKKIIKSLNIIKPPFNVNEVAQKAAVESLKDNKFLSEQEKIEPSETQTNQ